MSLGRHRREGSWKGCRGFNTIFWHSKGFGWIGEDLLGPLGFCNRVDRSRIWFGFRVFVKFIGFLRTSEV